MIPIISRLLIHALGRPAIESSGAKLSDEDFDKYALVTSKNVIKELNVF